MNKVKYDKQTILATYLEFLETVKIKPVDLVVVGDAASVILGLKDATDRLELDVPFSIYKRFFQDSTGSVDDKTNHKELGMGVYLRNKKYHKYYVVDVDGDSVTIPRLSRLTTDYIKEFISKDNTEEQADVIFEKMTDILELVRAEQLDFE